VPKKWTNPCRYAGCSMRTTQGNICDFHRKELKREKDSRRPNATDRGYGGDWRKTRDAVLRGKDLCDYCGGPAELVDHIVPVRFGGTNDPDNLVPCCRVCNARKAVEDNRLYASHQ
jgi:5-methylcytosine-specific restriction enzyme A